MPVPVVCPSCKKRFVVRPEFIGRRVNCTGCGTGFEVQQPKVGPPRPVTRRAPAPPPPPPPPPLDDLELVEPSFDVAVEPVPAPARSTAAPRPTPVSPARPAPRAGALEWTPWQRLNFRSGWQVAAMGAISLVLPLFGVQFRMLARARVQGPVVGIALIVFGLSVCGAVLLYRALLQRPGARRIAGRTLLVGALAVPLTCVLFVVAGAWLNRPGRRVEGPPQQASRPGPVSPGRAPDGFSQARRPK